MTTDVVDGVENENEENPSATKRKQNLIVAANNHNNNNCSSPGQNYDNKPKYKRPDFMR